MKVGIYCRLSEEDSNKQNKNDDSESIQNQKSMLIKYAVEQNWDIYNIYSDDDYTGSDRNRPAFNELLRDAELHKFDIVLCKTQSRFTRELEIVEKYIHGYFLEWNIRFVSIVDNADTAIKGNKKARQINGLINEWYLEDMSENIRLVIADKQKAGKYIGSFAPLGYKKDINDKNHLIIDSDGAEIVKLIYSMYLEGCGITYIARYLNMSHIPTATDYCCKNGLPYNSSRINTLWSFGTVKQILTNLEYTGAVVQGVYEVISYKTKRMRKKPKNQWHTVEDMHEAIISKEDFNKVQSILKGRSNAGTKTGKKTLFAGKIYCEFCGRKMYLANVHSKKAYRCSTHIYMPNNCEGAYISLTKLENTVLSEIKTFLSDFVTANKIAGGLNIYDRNNEIKTLKENINKLNHQIETRKKAIKNLYIDKVNEIINDRQFSEISQDFNNEIDSFGKNILEENERLNKIYSVSQCLKTKEEISRQYLKINELSFQLVDDLIEKIFIGRTEKYSRNVPIKIIWKI